MSTEAELLAMTADEFHAVVNLDLRKGTDDETWEALRSPAVFDRWWGALIGMSKSIDGQLGARREEFLSQQADLREQMRVAVAAGDVDKQAAIESRSNKTSKEYHRGRAGSLRFKSGLEEWLTEAKTIQKMRKAVGTDVDRPTEAQ